MLEPRRASGATAPRVLIVDDDDDIRQRVAFDLETTTGFDVSTAGNSFEAGFRLAHFRPQVVILDVVMPGMNGLDMCRNIRRLVQTDDLKVIVMTAYPDSRVVEGSIFEGADLFLGKPQDTQTLALHIEDLLDD